MYIDESLSANQVQKIIESKFWHHPLFIDDFSTHSDGLKTLKKLVDTYELLEVIQFDSLFNKEPEKFYLCHRFVECAVFFMQVFGKLMQHKVGFSGEDQDQKVIWSKVALSGSYLDGLKWKIYHEEKNTWINMAVKKSTRDRLPLPNPSISTCLSCSEEAAHHFLKTNDDIVKNLNMQESMFMIIRSAFMYMQHTQKIPRSEIFVCAQQNWNIDDYLSPLHQSQRREFLLRKEWLNEENLDHSNHINLTKKRL